MEELSSKYVTGQIMDMDALLSESCPAPYVAIVRREDFSRFPQGSIIDNAWAIPTQSSMGCLEAVVAWSANQMTSGTDPQQWRDWLTGFAAIGHKFDGNIKETTFAALENFPVDTGNDYIFFETLIAQRIDLRDYLRFRVRTNWEFQTLNAPDASSWHYNRYLAFWGERDAWDALRSKIAATQDANFVYAQFLSLVKLKAPAARDIIAEYLSDDRRVAVGASGSTVPLGEIAEGLLRPYLWQ